MTNLQRGNVSLTITPGTHHAELDEVSYEDFSCMLSGAETPLIEGAVGRWAGKPQPAYSADWPTWLNLNQAREFLPDAGEFEWGDGPNSAALLQAVLNNGLAPCRKTASQLSWYPSAGFDSPDSGPYFGLSGRTAYYQHELRSLIERTATAPLLEHLDDVVELLGFLRERLAG